jgi:hypothetical protein
MSHNIRVKAIYKHVIIEASQGNMLGGDMFERFIMLFFPTISLQACQNKDHACILAFVISFV